LIQNELLGLSDLDRTQQINELTYQVKQAYYNYLKTTQAIKLVEQNIDLLNEVKQFNEKLIKYDKATPDVISDVLYQLKKLESEKETISQQQELSKILLNTLMNRSIEETIEADESLLNQLPERRKLLSQLISTAHDNRQELEKINVISEVNRINQNRIEKSNQPTLAVQGGVGIQMENFSLDGGGPLYTLALNLGWKIWDGGLRKKQLEEARVVQEQNDIKRDIAKQQITLEVAQSYYELETLYAKYAAETEAISSARTSFTAINKRYKNERALLIELLTAQNKLLNSQLNQVLLGIDILISHAKIKKVINE